MIGTQIKTIEYEIAYDANGNQTLYVRYNWNSDKNDWVGFNKYECTYDANGNQTLYVRYNWDSDQNDWVGSYKEKYTYDANDNQPNIACALQLGFR